MLRWSWAQWHREGSPVHSANGAGRVDAKQLGSNSRLCGGRRRGSPSRSRAGGNVGDGVDPGPGTRRRTNGMRSPSRPCASVRSGGGGGGGVAIVARLSRLRGNERERIETERQRDNTSERGVPVPFSKQKRGADCRSGWTRVCGVVLHGRWPCFIRYPLRSVERIRGTPRTPNRRETRPQSCIPHLRIRIRGLSYVSPERFAARN